MMWKPNSKLAGAASRLCLTLALCAFAFPAGARAQERATRIRRLEPNVHAPNLYHDRLRFKMTLINLPGADDPGSYWEASYQIFFISESNFQNALRGAPEGGWSPTPESFPGRVLLGEGRIRRNSLRTLSERTHLSRPLAFRARVPDRARTKFATILTSYTVKIFDARLNSTVYRTGTFVAKPFTEDSAPGSEVARTTVYANFYVSPKGQLFYSQRRRDTQSTTWP